MSATSRALRRPLRPHRQRVHRRAVERRADGSHVRARPGRGCRRLLLRPGSRARRRAPRCGRVRSGRVTRSGGAVGDEREDEGHGRGNLAAAWRACKALSRDRRPALIVAGPTCSGKSALALALAERLGGTIVNADSMQVYRELRVLTARPTPEEEARVPARAVRRAFRRRGGQRRLVARGGARCDGGGAGGRAGADPVRRHRPLPRLARGRPRRHPRSGRGRADRGAGAAAERSARPRCTRGLPNATRIPPRDCGRATASGSPGRGRSGAARDAASPRGRPTIRRTSPDGRSPRCCSTRRARRSGRRSRRGSAR